MLVCQPPKRTRKVRAGWNLVAGIKVKEKGPFCIRFPRCGCVAVGIVEDRAGVTEAGDFRLSESRWYEGAHEKLMKGEHFGAE